MASSVLCDHAEPTAGETDIYRSTKKVRMRSEIVIHESDKKEYVADVELENSDLPNVVSYRNMLLHQGNNNSSDKGKEIIIGDEDYTTGHEGIIPTIDFSNRVRDMLIKGMERTLVVKLLGKYIWYHDLMQRVQALWKPKDSF